MDRRTRYVAPLDAMAKARGEIIERFATTEAVIDAIICAYYFVSQKAPSEFLEHVLCDEPFSLGLRRSIFEKILRQEKLYEDGPMQAIRKLAKLRNQAAHKSRGPTEARPSPALADEFMRTAGKVERYLQMVVEKLGIALQSGPLPTRKEIVAKPKENV